MLTAVYSIRKACSILNNVPKSMYVKTLLPFHFSPVQYSITDSNIPWPSIHRSLAVGPPGSPVTGLCKQIASLQPTSQLHAVLANPPGFPAHSSAN